MWSCYAQIVYATADGWEGSKSTPTFFIDGAVQGIMPGDTEHAKRVAKSVLMAVVDVLFEPTPELPEQLVEIHVHVSEV